jgi:hypothetical protein
MMELTFARECLTVLHGSQTFAAVRAAAFCFCWWRIFVEF